jgi:flavin reductase (DIM6/NTAB) family NADH-FMN oxidoreductase RutF
LKEFIIYLALKENDSMAMRQQGLAQVKKILFGNTLIPQEFFLGMHDPQMEISVWVYGMGDPIDVTRHHSMVCAAPLTICIAFEENRNPSEKDLGRLSLKFCEQIGLKRTLGEIGLKQVTVISIDSIELVLFEAHSSKNYCLPKVRLWSHYLFHAYLQRRSVDSSGIKMSFLEKRAAMVMFIRPHPVSLMSLISEAGGNIFPMNIMGDLRNGYFAFALKSSRLAAHLVEGAGRIALSSLPLSQAPLAYQLAANHKKQFIEWNELPFTTKNSLIYGVPVPSFSQRVRELSVKKTYPIGSHILFIAKIISDEIFSNSLGVSVIHGFYQAWRLKGRSSEVKTALAKDAHNKWGAQNSRGNTK